MPIIFSINKSRQTLEQQWQYLVQRGQVNVLPYAKKFLTILSILTGPYLLLYLLTAGDDFVTLKVLGMVLLGLAWIVFILFFLPFALVQMKREYNLQLYLNSITDDQLVYTVRIDEEKVSVTSVNGTKELLWNEFVSYGTHNDTLYVFNSVKGTNSIYLDESEMGSEVFTNLLELVQQKSLRKVF